MSINNLTRWLYFAAVPLALLAGSTLAVLGVLYDQPESEKERVLMPSFNFTTTGNHGRQKHQLSSGFGDTGIRDMFQRKKKEQVGDKLLEIHEIALGLVIIKEDTRLCITNGMKYMEGQGGTGFTVNKIESQGVWYQVGTKTVFLQTGAKIHVDDKGNIHEPASFDEIKEPELHK